MMVGRDTLERARRPRNPRLVLCRPATRFGLVSRNFGSFAPRHRPAPVWERAFSSCLLPLLVAAALIVSIGIGRVAAEDSISGGSSNWTPIDHPGETPPEEARGGRPDPLEPLNEKMFRFNLKLDDYILKPVATGYASVTTPPVRDSVSRFFNNVKVIPHVANNLFQLRFVEAGTDLARFGINSTLGVAGFFDPAQSWFGLTDYPDDFGLTLRYYGIPAGPYLMLPLLGPSTVTDTIGMVADNAMNPMSFLLPWYITVPAGLGRRGMETINYRAQHLDLFEEADRYAVDLYGAVQEAYLEKRTAQLRALLHIPPKSAYEGFPWVLIKAPSTNDFPEGSWDTPRGQWLTVKGFGSETECDDALEHQQERGEIRPLECVSTQSDDYKEIVRSMTQ